MPIKFKTEITNYSPIERAARHRVKDEGIDDLTEDQIKFRVSQYLRAQTQKTIPPFITGEVLESAPFREFLRDSKFFVHMNNNQIRELRREIKNTAKEGFGLLADMQQEADALNSLISEEEIKLLGNFDRVHFNSFVRQLDMGLDFDDKQWLVDYKTTHAFLVDNIADIIPGAGLTLPVRENIRVPIVDVVLIGEETDVGDSRFPIVESNPRHIFLPDKIWRYIIIRKEHEKTTRTFAHTPSYATLQLQLPNLQLINYIKIQPLSQRGLVVEELSFVNEAGESVPLETFEVNIETNQILLFEPIRTRYLKVKLRAHAPVTKTEYNVTDWATKELNDILRGSGWTQLLPETTSLIQGRVFDFSIESIVVGLRIYEPLGCYRSRPMRVKNPVGLAISERSASITVSGAQRTYGVDFSLPDGVVLNEYYLGIKLKTKAGRIAMNDLVPIPDSYPIQREFMPLVGAESKAKLFPDMLWNVDKYRVESVEFDLIDIVNINVIVTTTTPHGFVVNDTVSILGPAEYVLAGNQTIFEVVDDLSFKIGVAGLFQDQLVDENTVPRVYVYKPSTQNDPMTLNLENTTLTIGTDYEVSLDGGSTWYGFFPKGSEYINALTDRQAGNFRIKLLNPEYDRLYWIEYRPLKNQFLSKDKLVKLKNGRVVFDSSLRDTKGKISTVIVSRADNASPQVTPAVLFYALKVRERVS